jgi:hypothetical protein
LINPRNQQCQTDREDTIFFRKTIPWGKKAGMPANILGMMGKWLTLTPIKDNTNEQGNSSNWGDWG